MSAWQRLRFLPLRLTLELADTLARLLPSRRLEAASRGWKPGIAVLIPECGTPAVLAQTLLALEAALRGIAEPVRVRVLVNGAAPEVYAELRQRHAAVEWRFADKALGYSGAIEAGLRGLHEDWVYLLNSDMRLASDALSQVLALRQHDVFAIASRIDLADATRRREETGLTAWAVDGRLGRPYDVEPDGVTGTLEHLYAGGGASLFRTAVLKRYVARARCYAPFYFEDTDWGLSAWRDGWRVLFCPDSRATHLHRATIGRIDAGEVQRVAERNLWWLEARQGLVGTPPAMLLAVAFAKPLRTQRELAALRPLATLLLYRLAARRTLRSRVLQPGFVSMPARLPARAGGHLARLLWVARAPVARGAALEALRRAARSYEVILLGAHAEAYPDDAWRLLQCCHAIRLLGGSDEAELRATIAEATRHFRPGVVCVDGVFRHSETSSEESPHEDAHRRAGPLLVCLPGAGRAA